jgi:hypothetical protein
MSSLRALKLAARFMVNVTTPRASRLSISG